MGKGSIGTACVIRISFFLAMIELAVLVTVAAYSQQVFLRKENGITINQSTVCIKCQ